MDERAMVLIGIYLLSLFPGIPLDIIQQPCKTSTTPKVEFIVVVR